MYRRCNKRSKIKKNVKNVKKRDKNKEKSFLTLNEKR